MFSVAMLVCLPGSLMSAEAGRVTTQKYCVYDADVVMSKSQEWKEAITKLDEDSQKKSC